MILFFKFFLYLNLLNIIEFNFEIFYYERDTRCYIDIKDFIINDSWSYILSSTVYTYYGRGYYSGLEEEISYYRVWWRFYLFGYDDKNSVDFYFYLFCLVANNDFDLLVINFVYVGLIASNNGILSVWFAYRFVFHNIIIESEPPVTK